MECVNMVNIKKDRYKIRFKAYISYPCEEKIVGTFLDEKYDKLSRIKLEDNSLDTRISKELAAFIVSHGGMVETIKVLKHVGKKKLFGIPVEIKSKHNEFIIRLVGKTRNKLSEDIEYIKNELLKFGVKPTKVCSWRRLEDFDEKESDDDEIEEIETNEDIVVLEIPRLDDIEETDDIDKEEKIDKMEKEDKEEANEADNKGEVVCPDCGSTNLKELLHTPSGIRTKCLDCEEIFVNKVNIDSIIREK
jgi:hypothetical protein